MKLVYSTIALSAVAYNIQHAVQECIMMSYSVKMDSNQKLDVEGLRICTAI